MSDNVIKEFLISLGFKTDGEEKFTKMLDSVSEGVAALGTAVLAAGATVAAAVTKMASDFDKLYWSTKNLGSSASDVRAMGYAFSQLGGSADDASAAMMSIANFNMHFGAGAQGFLKGLGVDPKDIGNSAATLRDLEKIFQRMTANGDPNGLARANAIAGALGISSDQLRVMLRDTGEFEGRYKEFARSLGIDLDGMADKSNSFMTSLREMKAEFGLVFDYATFKVLDWLLPKLQALSAWARELVSGHNLKGISGELQQIIQDVGALVGALGHLYSSDGGRKWGQALLWVLDNVIREVTQFTKVIDDLINRRWHQAWVDANTDPTISWHDSQGNSGTPSTPSGGNSGGGSASRSASPVSRDRLTNLVNALTMRGINPSTARGIGAGIIAEGGSLNARNPTSGAFGLGQWLGARKRALFAKYGAHPTASQQLDFLVSELMGGDRGGASVLGQHGAEGAMVAYLRDFMRPGPGLGGDLSRGYAALGTPSATLGGSGVQITQKTDIHVHGGDGRQIANDVADQQDGVNQRMVAAASVYAW